MKRQPQEPWVGPVVYGIDVSKWQGGIDWDVVAVDPARPQFAIVRIGDGKDVDSLAIENLRGAARVGLLVGAYHYLRGDRDGEMQARLVDEVIRESGVVLTLPVFVDYERKSAKNLPGGIDERDPKAHPWVTPRQALSEAIEMAETLETLGYHVGVYGGEALHWHGSQAHPDLAELLGRWPLWHADYRRTERIPTGRDGQPFPWPRSTIWQYTSSDTVSGIAGHVDGNLFKGTIDDLRRLGGTTRPPSTLADELEELATRASAPAAAIIVDAAARVRALAAC